ncbi:MAG: pilus assembly protein PilP [Betaproteobacteria bacterium]|nr:pilus assembly protein PilP [Betaproteobacteria bacterium]
MKRACIVLLAALSGCGGGDFSDLKAFMEQAGKTGIQPLEPLPALKILDAPEYDPANLPDPFRSRSMKSAKAGGLQPDVNRQKVYLERFPLDGLRIIGTLDKSGQLAALVRTPENHVQIVRKGDFIGQNNGVVINVREAGLDIREIVQDGNGDWVEANASLTLQE